MLNDQTLARDAQSAPPPPWHPVRTAFALIIGSMVCMGPFMAFNAVFLPARVQEISPDSKVSVVALLATSGVIVATVANVLFGALSDMTRSRFGRRSPWMVVGSIGATVGLLVVATAGSIPVMVAGWCLFQLFLNAIIAPLIAMLPDRVPKARRGTMSALYGLGQLLGIALIGQVAAPQFLDDPKKGMLLFAIPVLLGGPLIALIAREPSNLDQPREPVSTKSLMKSFAFPMHESHDYYSVFFGRVFNIVGTYVVSGYQLYILTDYLGATTSEAGRTMSLLGLLQLVGSVIVGTAVGPVSDLFKRRKPFIVGATLVCMAGTAFLYFVQEPWAMLVFGICAALGGGIYNSVEQVVSTEVLPESDTAAKDLGFLNVAATGGQAIAPGVTSLTIAIAGSFAPAFLVATGFLGASAVLFARLKKTR
jgi:MFS family permease